MANDTKSTPCPECGAGFALRHHMLRHYRSKHEGVKYPCNQCNYQATSQGYLQNHISAKHGNTVLKCDSCDYQTKWKLEYYKHQKTHTAVE